MDGECVYCGEVGNWCRCGRELPAEYPDADMGPVEFADAELSKPGKAVANMSETSVRCPACGRAVWIGRGRAIDQPCYECLVKEVERLRGAINAAERLDVGEEVQLPQPHPRIVSIIAGNRLSLSRMAGKIDELESEVERLRAALLTCSNIACGEHNAIPSDRCASIVIHVDSTLHGFEAAKAAGGE